MASTGSMLCTGMQSSIAGAGVNLHCRCLPVNQVTMDLEEPDEGTTVLKLRQTGIPEVDRFGNEMREGERQVEEGWKAQILHRLRAVFGYGM